MIETIENATPTLELQENWSSIKEDYRRSYKSNFHVTMGTLDTAGRINLAPIGSLILKKDMRGFYFDIFATQLSKNLDANPEITVQFVNSSSWFWLKSLAAGKFATAPATRLFGIAGPRRKATELEISRWEKRIAAAKFLKGYSLLWKNCKYVRDIHFHDFQRVNLGKMTR